MTANNRKNKTIRRKPNPQSHLGTASPDSFSFPFLSPIKDLLFIPFRLIIFVSTFFGMGMGINVPSPGKGGVVRIKPSHPALVSLRTASTNGPAGDNTDGAKEEEVEQRTLNKWIDDTVPSLKEGFRPSWWLPNGHLQTFFTVVGDFTKVDLVHYYRTYLRLPDGGTIGLDTTLPPHDHALPENAPTVVVSHGLTGGSHESYVRNVLAQVIKPVSEGGLGARGIVVNFRGCAGVPVTSCQLYSAGTTMDLALALHHIRHRYPSSPLLGVGFSLGASIMSRYLGETGSASLLSAAAVLGCPWDLEAGSHKLETPWFTSNVYSSALAQNILKMFFNVHRRNPSAFDTAEMQDVLPALEAMRRKGRKARLKDVDDLLVSKIGGPRGIGAWPFANAVEYYRWASPSRLLGGVRVPLLAINAFDDPVVDTTSLPLEELQSSSHVYVAVTSSGGHLGWFDGPLRSSSSSKKRWVVKPVLEFFTAAQHLPLSPAVELELESTNTKENGGGEEISDAEALGWEWVRVPAHDIPGVQRVGWKVLREGEIVEGEQDSGVMQGL